MSSKGNFVTLKIKGKETSSGKKTLIPPSIESLIKTANKFFNFPENRPAQVFFDEDMLQISSVKDIVPGTTVYVSQDIPDDMMVSSNQITQNLQNSPQSPSRVSFPGGGSGLVSPIANPLSPSRAQVINGSPGLQSALMSRPVSMLQSRPGSRAQSSLMIVVNDPNTPPKTRKKNDDICLDDADQFECQDDDKKRFAETGISHEALQRLLTYLPKEFTMEDNIMESVMEQLSPLVGRLGTQAEKVQPVQNAYLYSLISSSLRKIPKHSEFLDEKVVNLINDATFGTEYGSSMHFRHIIVGPRKSGKSVFLDLLANATLLRMISSGQIKRTLFMFLDFRDFGEIAKANPIEFYKRFVKVVLETISRQRIEFQPYLENLVKYFQRLPELDKLQKLPQNFISADEFHAAQLVLAEVASELFDSINTCSLPSFIQKVLSLPKYFARAFNFANVHFFVDHINAADVDLFSREPFDTELKVVMLVENVKYMLSNASFVIACDDADKALDCLMPTEEEVIDLRDGIEIVPITDIDDGHSNAFEYYLTIEDFQQEVRLRLVDCGACSGFLAKWDDIIETTKLYQEELQIQSDASDSKNETYLSILAKIRELVPLILIKVDPETQEPMPLDDKIIKFRHVQLETDEETQER